MIFVMTACLSVAAFLLTRALLVEGRGPTSAWRDVTFGRQSARGNAQQQREALVSSRRSLFERMATGLPRLQAPADRIVATAGLSGKVSGAWLIGFSLVTAGIAFVAWMAMAGGGGFGQQEMLMGLGATALGGVAPWIVLSSRGKRRQEAIDRALPDVLDLLTVSIEAGLAMEGALQRVSQRESGPLQVEIRRTLNEIALGRRRSEALTAMAQRTEVPPLQTLVSAINQAERTGLQMGPVMRAQSEQIRVRRRQRAEEKAMKAPVKMLFPLVAFIFPSMFIVIIGPAAISFAETFGG